MKKSMLVLFGILAAAGVTLPMLAAEYLSGKVWPEPKVVDPGAAGGPPSDAIVLFDGKDLSQWKGGGNVDDPRRLRHLRPDRHHHQASPSATASSTWNGPRRRKSRGTARDAATAACS